MRSAFCFSHIFLPIWTREYWISHIEQHTHWSRAAKSFRCTILLEVHLCMYSTASKVMRYLLSRYSKAIYELETTRFRVRRARQKWMAIENIDASSVLLKISMSDSVFKPPENRSIEQHVLLDIKTLRYLMWKVLIICVRSHWPTSLTPDFKSCFQRLSLHWSSGKLRYGDFVKTHKLGRQSTLFQF